MALHRLTPLAVVVALALGLSGCGDDSPSPAPTTSSVAASPTATASGPAAPVLPDLAKRNDEVGAKAFVKYWFALANHAIDTGDTNAVQERSSSKCLSCDNLIASVRNAYKDGGRIEGGGLEILGVEHDPRLKHPLHRFAVRLEQQAKREVDRSGTVVSRERKTEALFFAAVEWTGGRFQFLGMERIDD